MVLWWTFTKFVFNVCSPGSGLVVDGLEAITCLARGDMAGCARCVVSGALDLVPVNTVREIIKRNAKEVAEVAVEVARLEAAGLFVPIERVDYY